MRDLLEWNHQRRWIAGWMLLVLMLSLLVDAAGTVAIWLLERHAPGTDIHSFGDALYSTTIQLVTLSSQGAITTAGRIVDVLLSLWALLVVVTGAGFVAAYLTASPSLRQT
ncbi:MAG TPA: hypothetical protein VGQ38_11675 [Gaiellaceae bacterium]|nr:hypothetical protein [Gaiellaceae bacterium]